MRLAGLALVTLAGAAACSAPPLPCGSSSGSASVPGVTIAIDTETCDVGAGQDVTFHYETQVTSPLSFMTGPHAGCTPTFNDPKSFTAIEIIGAGSSRYCPTCDPGTCSTEDPGEMITIPTGSYAATLDWPGLQWDGPGDSGNNPLGAAFPTGPAVVHVVFTVPGGKIDAQLPISID